MSLLSIETSANIDILNQVVNQNVWKIIYKHQYANVSYEICTYVHATPMYKHMQTKCIRISGTQCMFIENTLPTGESPPPPSLYHYKYWSEVEKLKIKFYSFIHFRCDLCFVWYCWLSRLKSTRFFHVYTFAGIYEFWLKKRQLQKWFLFSSPGDFIYRMHLRTNKRIWNQAERF